MNRRILALGALLVGVLALTGCSSGSSTAEKAAPTRKVWGYVAAQKNAQLDVAPIQDSTRKLVVGRVLAPQDAWLVVHLDDGGKPGKRVGLKHVSGGESANVVVPLKGVTTDKVILALHADRATPGKFDFDMMNKEMSADRPFFVGGKELATVITVK